MTSLFASETEKELVNEDLGGISWDIYPETGERDGDVGACSVVWTGGIEGELFTWETTGRQAGA